MSPFPLKENKTLLFKIKDKYSFLQYIFLVMRFDMAKVIYLVRIDLIFYSGKRHQKKLDIIFKGRKINHAGILCRKEG